MFSEGSRPPHEFINYRVPTPKPCDRSVRGQKLPYPNVYHNIGRYIYFDYSSFLFTSPKHGIRFTRPNFDRNNLNFERPSNFLSKERIKVKIFKNYPPNEPEYGSETGLTDVE